MQRNDSNTFTIRVFNKEYYDKAFDEIRKIPISWFPSRITEFIRKKLSSNIFLVNPLEKETLTSLLVYRARVLKKGEQVDENKVSHFSYPPKKIGDRILAMGRANRIGQQVFYGTIDKHTAIIEVSDNIIENDSIVYISTWEIKDVEKHTNMKVLFSGLSVDKDSYAAVFMRMVENNFNKAFQNMPEPHRTNFYYAQKKYQELFTSTGKKFYHISSSIVHDVFVRYLKQKVNVPIIAYPSVAKKKESINFAIRKDFVDSHLRLKQIDKVRVTSIKNEEITFTGLKRAIVKDGKIVWLKLDVQIEDINYKSVSLYTEVPEEPKRFVHVQDNEKLLCCCDKHFFSAKHYVENMLKLTTEQIIHKLTHSIPIADFDEKATLKYHMAIPTQQDIFIKTTEKMNPIYFIGLNINCNLEYR
ncbi:MAG: hypothetical protein VR77_08470 [Flavobacteriales bacterium BRH_c54]|nr:MAG: hypothetical protein VR77_08470 [Flavobacteriales bacterium BRH_c54]